MRNLFKRLKKRFSSLIRYNFVLIRFKFPEINFPNLWKITKRISFWLSEAIAIVTWVSIMAVALYLFFFIISKVVGRPLSPGTDGQIISQYLLDPSKMTIWMKILIGSCIVIMVWRTMIWIKNMIYPKDKKISWYGQKEVNYHL